MNAVAEVKNQNIAEVAERPQDNTSIASVIARAAADPSVDVGKLERLIALSNSQDAREAERAFNAAMTRAQKQIRPIAADANNPQTKSKYASYLALDKALRPIYTDNGFSLSFDTDDSPKPDHIRVLCYVAHDDGHSRTYKSDMPADGKGAKGGDVMTKTHASGAAMTYGQRYLLKMIFNIAVGEDDDGNGGNVKSGPISAEQVETIRELIESTGADIEKFCKYFKVEAIPDLAQKDYDRVIANLNLKMKQVQK